MGTECKECGGVGTIEVDGKLRECICEFLRRIGAGMPPIIRTANVMPEHARLPILDLVDRSLYLTGRWEDVRAIVKAVWIKHFRRHISITSDREIRDVYVGSMSRAAKGKDAEDDVFNNLADLAQPPDLTVIRLGELSYKNKAAPGALEEACSYRLDRNKATWVLSDSDKPFNQASHAWSQSLMHLFNSSMARFEIPAIAPRPEMVNYNTSRVVGSQIASRTATAVAAGAAGDAGAAPDPPEDGPEPPEESPYDPPDDELDEFVPKGLRGIGAGLNRGWKGKGRR